MRAEVGATCHLNGTKELAEEPSGPKRSLSEASIKSMEDEIEAHQSKSAARVRSRRVVAERSAGATALEERPVRDRTTEACRVPGRGVRADRLQCRDASSGECDGERHEERWSAETA